MTKQFSENNENTVNSCVGFWRISADFGGFFEIYLKNLFKDDCQIFT